MPGDPAGVLRTPASPGAPAIDLERAALRRPAGARLPTGSNGQEAETSLMMYFVLPPVYGREST